jgi:hypothetical protein
MAAQGSSLLVVTQVGATEHDIILFPKSYVWVCPEGVTSFSALPFKTSS